MNIMKIKIKVYDMTCTSCENRIKKELENLEGVISAKAKFREDVVFVEFDSDICNITMIKSTIEMTGYNLKPSNNYKFVGMLIIVAAIILLGLKTSGFDMEEKLNTASYAALFIVGILTSIHCVGMCGGIMLSQSLQANKSKFQSIKPSILYNLGRVISYTILGGIIGGIGSVFALSSTMKATIQILAAVFMIIMGFNMAGFKVFRKLQIKLPSFICRTKNKAKSPFIVGILNGFMPCGPLQTMQIFALGTGSALKGSLSMLIFSLGTIPLMLGFGVLSGILSKGYTKKILKLSGVLIIVLGLIMGNRGLLLYGININPLTAIASSTKNALGMGSNTSDNSNVQKAVLQNGVQVITMSANNNGYTPNAFYVQKGIPVKWIINGDQLNSCNNAIVAPSINKELKIKKGENIIEFTPNDGDISFTCWMGMISGVIKVVDNLDSVDTSVKDPSIPEPSTGPSCCASPVDEEDGNENKTDSGVSIYGDDIKKVTTNKLVNKVSTFDNSYFGEFIGKSYELQPLIMVTDSSKKTTLTFDLSGFDEAVGEYLIRDINTGDVISKFNGKKGVNEIEFTPKSSTSYAVVKDKTVLGIIESVDNIKNANLEDIRIKYLGEKQ